MYFILNDDISSISTSFQDGCNTIVSGCTTYGSTPASNSPDNIVAAIKTIYNNRYTTGYNAGKADSGSLTVSGAVGSFTAPKAGKYAIFVCVRGQKSGNAAVTFSASIGGITAQFTLGYQSQSGVVNCGLSSNAGVVTLAASQVISLSSNYGGNQGDSRAHIAYLS